MAANFYGILRLKIVAIADLTHFSLKNLLFQKVFIKYFS